jgi:hypothetical protein
MKREGICRIAVKIGLAVVKKMTPMVICRRPGQQDKPMRVIKKL